MLETTTRKGIGAGFAKILINNLHPLTRPSQFDSALHQRILEFGAFGVTRDLHERGLANVDIGHLGPLVGGWGERQQLSVHDRPPWFVWLRSEEHTSELQSPMYLVCRLLLEKK